MEKLLLKNWQKPSIISKQAGKSMISVIIPLYNKEAIVKRSIESVLTQNYEDFEIIVVNDGSTDKSAEIVRKIKDSRVRLIEQTNGGPSKARNTGVKNAKGKWILFLDADDELLPDALQYFDRAIKQNPSISFICAPFYRQIQGKESLTYNYAEKIIDNPFREYYLGRFFPRTGAFVCKREQCKQVLFDERIRRFEDLEWLFRIYRQALVVTIKEPVLKNNLMFSSASRARKAIKEDFLGYLDFNGKSFWEKMALYSFFLGEKDYYGEQCKKLYPWLYRRYDWLLINKIIGWMK